VFGGNPAIYLRKMPVSTGLSDLDFFPMAKGWISISRNIQDNYLWKDSKVKSKFEAWIDMLFLAKYKESKMLIRGNVVIIGRGQLAYSQETLCERWKWSRIKVNSFLNMLEKEQQIVQQKSKLITLISITNYNQYQDLSTTDNTTDSTTDYTSKGTTDSTTTKQSNKGNKENNDNNLFTNVNKETDFLKEIIWPFTSENFKKNWQIWEDYRKEKKLAKYKKIGLQAALKKLSELSKGNEYEAIQILHQSIANNYQGIFELKNKNNGQNKRITEQDAIEALSEGLAKGGYSR